MRIDRTTTTPFLLRVFSSHGNFHRLDEFDSDRQPRDELNIYSWKDATLGELTSLLAKELVGDSQRDLISYKFSYRLVFGDANHGRYQIRDLGTIQLHDKSSEAQKSLDDIRFVIGDWIDIAILKPGDRLYDARSSNRSNYCIQAGRGGGGVGQGSRSSYRDRHTTDTYRPYDRRERNSIRSPVDNRRWAHDSYRSSRI